MALLATLKERARALTAEAHAVYLVARHPQTPWYAKLLAAAVVAYAFSPIDLIPDFIPVLGYLDDLVIVPAGIALVIRLIPADVLAECRAQAAARASASQPVNLLAGALIVALWLLLAALGLAWAYRRFRRP
jgi:uncharacterized membrane protein YkvA (DUF1232 family)